MYQGSHHLSNSLPHTELSMHGMNTMSCPLGDTTEVDAELSVACGSADSDGPPNEEGVVALATLAPSVTIGSEWSSVLSEGLSEDQMTSRMTSK